MSDGCGNGRPGQEVGADVLWGGMRRGKKLPLEGSDKKGSVGDGSGRAQLTLLSHPLRLACNQAPSRCSGDSCWANPHRSGGPGGVGVGSGRLGRAMPKHTHARHSCPPDGKWPTPHTATQQDRLPSRPPPIRHHVLADPNSGKEICS